MNFSFYLPTELISGYNSVLDNGDKLAIGKKCVIVCGRNSAKQCGALDDVTRVLDEKNVGYVVYNKITENPLVSVCYEGGQVASEFGADFIIAIGGGSPLDAGKAIAAYAANSEISPLDIFGSGLKQSLPIIAIPTTAGTGSESNRYSILTIDGKNIKKSFKSKYSYPKCSFLDSKYTNSLPLSYTVSTALDTFCHCIESYLSPKATEISKMLSIYGGGIIYKALKKIDSTDKSDMDTVLLSLREGLMCAASAGGIAIDIAGTGSNHPLGYNLTMYNNIPHGKACGAFMGEYVSYNKRVDEGKKLLDEFSLSACGEDADSVANFIVKMSGVNVKLTDEEIELYLDNVSGALNYQNSPYVINKEEMKAIYKKLFS